MWGRRWFYDVRHERAKNEIIANCSVHCTVWLMYIVRCAITSAVSIIFILVAIGDGKWQRYNYCVPPQILIMVNTSITFVLNVYWKLNGCFWCQSKWKSYFFDKGGVCVRSGKIHNPVTSFRKMKILYWANIINEWKVLWSIISIGFLCK